MEGGAKKGGSTFETDAKNEGETNSGWNEYLKKIDKKSAPHKQNPLSN